LNQGSELVIKLWNILAPDERNRADRFYFEKERIHFIVARGVLRDILSHYLDTPPQNLEFSYGPFGKPELKGRVARKHLRFNISHSHGLALYAITNNREIGVDLELIREESGSLDIADRFFSPQEILSLRELPREVQSTAFFNCWTRKEAYLKARGVGIPYRMERFTLGLAPGEPAVFRSSEEHPGEVSTWFLMELPVSESYASALVCRRPVSGLNFWRWNPNQTSKGTQETAVASRRQRLWLPPLKASRITDPGELPGLQN
jgi:4'-phosphopantetheinyl transferase